MLDSNQPLVPRRDPWTKGRLIGEMRLSPFVLRETERARGDKCE
jgi:hypothetical protein